MPSNFSAASSFLTYIQKNDNVGIEQINGLKLNGYTYNVTDNGIGEVFIQATKDGGVYPFCKLNPSDVEDSISHCAKTILEKQKEIKRKSEEKVSESIIDLMQNESEGPIFELKPFNSSGGKMRKKTQSKSRKSKSRKSKSRKSRKSKKSK